MNSSEQKTIHLDYWKSVVDSEKTTKQELIEICKMYDFTLRGETQVIETLNKKFEEQKIVIDKYSNLVGILNKSQELLHFSAINNNNKFNTICFFLLISTLINIFFIATQFK